MSWLHSGPIFLYFDVCTVRKSPFSCLLGSELLGAGQVPGGGGQGLDHVSLTCLGAVSLLLSHHFFGKSNLILSQLEEAQQLFLGIMIVSKARFVRKLWRRLRYEGLNISSSLDLAFWVRGVSENIGIESERTLGTPLMEALGGGQAQGFESFVLARAQVRGQRNVLEVLSHRSRVTQVPGAQKRVLPRHFLPLFRTAP